MEIFNNRIAHTSNSSLGLLSFEKENPIGVIIEDEPRKEKIKKETRIPYGRYKLGIRKEDTPLTLKHRKKYGSWFRYHIEVLNVPNFSYIYFHAGNNEKHTDGCQIGGYIMKIVNGEFECRESILFMKEFYNRVYPLLEKGVTVYYNIIDEI